MRIDPGGNSRDPQPTVRHHGTGKTGTNATLSYRNGAETNIYTLWVTKIEQPHELTGEKHQGLKSSHFYPKSYAPGKLQLSGQHDGQPDLMALGGFIRGHHEALIGHVGGFDTHRRKLTANSEAFALLMHLTIPSEAIDCRGYVEKFTLTRLGVVERTPEFSFPFTVVYDGRNSDFKRSRIVIPLRDPKTKAQFTPQPTERD